MLNVVVLLTKNNQLQLISLLKPQVRVTDKSLVGFLSGPATSYASGPATSYASGPVLHPFWAKGPD